MPHLVSVLQSPSAALGTATFDLKARAWALKSYKGQRTWHHSSTEKCPRTLLSPRESQNHCSVSPALLTAQGAAGKAVLCPVRMTPAASLGLSRIQVSARTSLRHWCWMSHSRHSHRNRTRTWNKKDLTHLANSPDSFQAFPTTDGLHSLKADCKHFGSSKHSGKRYCLCSAEYHDHQLIVGFYFKTLILRIRT